MSYIYSRHVAVLQISNQYFPDKDITKINDSRLLSNVQLQPVLRISMDNFDADPVFRLDADLDLASQTDPATLVVTQ
jgi:hypothetical protein